MTSTIGIKKIQHPNGTQVMTFDTAGKISSDVSSTGNITTTGTVNTPSINGQQIGGRRNLIINGAMAVSQRGTSSTSVTSSGYRSAPDRFRPSIGTAGTWTISQSTDVPTGQGFANSYKFDCTTANGSLSAGSDMALQYRMEGRDAQLLRKGTSSAQALTLSFWVKSTKTGTFICELMDNDNAREISKSYTVNSSNTWEYKTVTFEGDTTGALDNDNARSLTLQWWLVAGTNWTSGTLNTSWSDPAAANRVVGQVNIADSTSNDWLITGVQMEIGEKATEFEHELYSVTLQKALRYYQKHVGWITQFNRGLDGNYDAHVVNNGVGVIGFMRATPTETIDNVYRWDAGDSNWTSDSTAFSAAISSSSQTFVEGYYGRQDCNAVKADWELIAEL